MTEINTDAADKEVGIKEEFNSLTEDQKLSVTFQHLINNFNYHVQKANITNKRLKKLWANSAVAPLNKEELTGIHEKEKELYDLYNQINSIKLLLIIKGMEKEGKIVTKGDLFSPSPVREA